MTLVSLSPEFHYVKPTPKQYVIMQCNNVATLFMHDGHNADDQNFNLFTLIRARMQADPC